jgi:hypothetical protein
MPRLSAHRDAPRSVEGIGNAGTDELDIFTG